MGIDELTRRVWLLRLGGATVLGGFSGIDLSAAPGAKLPPGLYEPDVNHLAHAMHMQAAKAAEPLGPQFFSAGELATARRLVSLILDEPADGSLVLEITQWLDLILARAGDVRKAALALSPEHRKLAINFYGEASVRELEETDAQKLCCEGLARVPNDPEDLERNHDPFFRWFKSRVIEGFYTSREGLKELDYKGNSFYQESPGCEHISAKP